MVYARDPADLDEAMESATKISAGYEIADGVKKEANLVEQVEDLKNQINNIMLANVLATSEPTINNLTPRNQQIPPLNRPYEQPQQTQWQQPQWQQPQWQQPRQQNRNNNRNNNRSQVQCFGCKGYGHYRRDCPNNQQNWQQNPPNNNNNNQNNRPNNGGQNGQRNSRPNNGGWRNNNNSNNRNNQNDNNPFRNINNVQQPFQQTAPPYQFQSQPFQNPPQQPPQQNQYPQNYHVNNVEVQAISTPPVKPYNIVPDIWNHPANVTIGELLANEKYRNDLQTALNTMKNKSVNNLDHSKLTALTRKVNVNGEVYKAIPDSGAAISVISIKLVKKMGLEDKIVQEDSSKLRALAGHISTRRVIKDAPLKIATAEIPIDLQVVDTTEEDFLLGMDWFNKYEVTLKTKEKELIFRSKGLLFKTFVNSEKVNKPTCFMITIVEEYEEEIRIVNKDEWEREGYPLVD